MKEKRKGKKLKNPFQGVDKKAFIINFVAALVIGVASLIFTRSILGSIITFVAIYALLIIYAYMKVTLKESLRIKKMEAVFPDFLQLMSSNLRAGITTDKAILLSARKEFDPLDKEIIKVGKDLFTGRPVESSLLKMAKRIKSEKIEKTIRLIVSGIRAGGNMSVLLEETATSMRERNFLEKRSSSSVLMYVIFIFVATAFGAPALFGLSSVLVEILGNLLATIPSVESSSANLPFTLTEISVSPAFITYFSLIFLVVTDILGSLVIGLVNKGEEKQGLKYLFPLIAASLAVFFLVRIMLNSYFSDLFG